MLWGGMDHGLGLGVGFGVRVGWEDDVAWHVENSFSQRGSIQEDFDDENIGGKEFENAHEIDSEFESNNDDAYNSSEEEDSEYIDDDGNDMSIKIYTMILLGVKNSILTIQDPMTL